MGPDPYWKDQLMKRMYAAAAAVVLSLGSAPAWADGSDTSCYTYWDQVPAAPATAVWYVEREVCPPVSTPVPPPGSPKMTAVPKVPAKKSVSSTAPKERKRGSNTPLRAVKSGVSPVLHLRSATVVSLKVPQMQKTPLVAVSSTPTAAPTASAPAERAQEKKLADTGVRGVSAVGVGVGLVVAGIGVLILVRRKRDLG